MHKSIRAGLAFISAGVVTASLLVTGTASANTQAATVRRVCAGPQPGHVSCDAWVSVDAAGHAFVSRHVGPNAGPPGWHPADLQKAYNLTSVIGHSGTVAIVDAFDDPRAENDLGVYRKQFGLSPCTTANGCFKKVNQNGATSPLPAPAPPNDDWALEISLDIEMVSAVCPKCHIILVEANNDSWGAISTAAKKAGSLAHIVSNSYGDIDQASLAGFASAYTKKGVQYVASSGDDGFNGRSRSGPQVPAAFQPVTAVGGTVLSHASNARGFSEKVWPLGNSGCSVTTAKPSWQHDPLCHKRMIADVAAVAQSLAVYDTFNNVGGWVIVGGTSASAPIVASVYALAGNAGSIPNNASHIYANASHLFDVTAGSNGTCGGNYECTAKPGYDGPTGLGTPNGVGAF